MYEYLRIFHSKSIVGFFQLNITRYFMNLRYSNIFITVVIFKLGTKQVLSYFTMIKKNLFVQMLSDEVVHHVLVHYHHEVLHDLLYPLDLHVLVLVQVLKKGFFKLNNHVSGL